MQAIHHEAYTRLPLPEKLSKAIGLHGKIKSSMCLRKKVQGGQFQTVERISGKLEENLKYDELLCSTWSFEPDRIISTACTSAVWTCYCKVFKRQTRCIIITSKLSWGEMKWQRTKFPLFRDLHRERRIIWIFGINFLCSLPDVSV